MASLRTPFGRSGQVNLEPGARENHRAHVSSVRHQARQLPEAVLQIDQSSPHLRQGRHFGGVDAGLFGADQRAHVFTVQPHFAAVKTQLQVGQQGDDAGFKLGGGCQALPDGGQTGNAVNGARIQKVVAQALGQFLRQSAFAGGGGAVNA